MTQVAVLTGYGAARPVRTSLVIVAGAPWRSQEETTLSPLPTQIRLSHFQYARLLARRHRDQSRLVVLRMGDCPATSRAGGGITLATPGVGVATRLIHENVRETNIMYGIGGPLLQMVLFFRRALRSATPRDRPGFSALRDIQRCARLARRIVNN